jgi:hypothetical protein
MAVSGSYRGRPETGTNSIKTLIMKNIRGKSVILKLNEQQIKTNE